MTCFSHLVSRHESAKSLLLAVGAALLVSACGAVDRVSVSTGSSASPTAVSEASSAAPARPSGTPTAARSASVAPSGRAAPGGSARPAASTSAQPTAAPSAPCAIEPQTVDLPSDRFTSVVITPRPDEDLVTFRFGNASVPGPPAAPRGSLGVAVPPLTQAGSGKPIALAGGRAIQIRFTNMSIQNDVGQPVYDGPREYKPDLPALQQMTLFDMSEGVVGWYLGFDGTGCVSMVPAAGSVTVRIAHG